MKVKTLLVSMALLTVSAAVTAQDGAKIGIVDADNVIQQSKKGKAFFEEFQAFQQSKREEIDRLVEAYREAEKALQAQAAALSEDASRERQAELQRKQNEIKRAQEDAQRESSTRLQDKLEEFRKELIPLVRQVALERGLDLVMNLGPNSNLVYINERIDITDDVLRKYDQQ